MREAVIDRLLDDGMSMNRLHQALQRDFHLDLSDGFLYDCLDWKVRQTDLPTYRHWTLEHFSGTLCIDELHLGHRTLLLATDPLSDFPVAFALVSANDHNHMRRFLANLKNHSNLYPTLLAELWPQARHQLCVFHVIKDINACVLDALRRLRRCRTPCRRRQPRRGRLSRAQKRTRSRQQAHRKQQLYFIWKHRHLIVSRPEHLNGLDRRWLSQMFRFLPALLTLRRFVLKVYRLFAVQQSVPQARCRRLALVQDAAFLADPDLARALAMLPADKFDKMMAYLHSPASQRVRTNNHVERTNRSVRYFEKVRYKWRRRGTIVRFIVLALQRWHQHRASTPSVKKPRTARHKHRHRWKRAA